MSQRPVLEPKRVQEARPVQPPAARPRPRIPVRQSNPTFGLDYWTLGLLAAAPALLGSAGFLVCVAHFPRVPRPTVGLLIGALLVALALGAVLVHHLDYPAWSHPGVTLLPVLGLFLPAATLHGIVLDQVDGDPDRFTVGPFGITWLLLVLAAAITVITGLVVGRHAPSFSGAALLPLPLILSWVLVLAPDFREQRLVAGLASLFALVAIATFVAWVVPRSRRPFVPPGALALQFAMFWWYRFGWPDFRGAVRPALALDIVLYVALVALVAAAPFFAGWARRAGWPEVQRLLGYR